MSAMAEMILTRDLARGYRAAVAAYDLVADAGLLAFGEAYEAAEGRRLARTLLRRARGQRPTAVVVDAVMAPGVYEAATELGLAIPDDLAVIAHGDAPDARSLRPALSAIRASHYECGRVGAQTLLDLILGRTSPPAQVYLEPALDIRDSCGPHDDGEAGRAAGPREAPAARRRQRSERPERPERPER
jgi:DNA-binding LacI/PurR family transcriptional regulator